MNNDLISRSALNIDELCRLRSDLKTGLVVGSTLRTQTQIDRFIKALDDVIDNAPTVTEQFLPKVTECEVCKANMTGSTDKALEERPQDEMVEIKHRLNLLIGVLYSNSCISESDLEYIEDSIKKLMKGGAE